MPGMVELDQRRKQTGGGHPTPTTFIARACNARGNLTVCSRRVLRFARNDKCGHSPDQLKASNSARANALLRIEHRHE